MTHNFTWLQVRCTACGWRGQKPTSGINKYLTVTCPICGHTGKAAVPPPPARALPARVWPPAGVRRIASIWADGKTPPAGWQSPAAEAAWASVEG